MKLALLIAALALTGCVAIQGRICYETPQGQVCVGGNAGGLTIDGTFTGQK